MSDFYLNGKYEATIYSSVCETVAASRYCKKLQGEGLLGANNQFAKGSYIMISDGEKTFFGGEGQLFQEFLYSRQLTGYVDTGQAVATIKQPNYSDAQLAMVCFDQSFKTLPYDASKHKLFEILCIIFYMRILIVISVWNIHISVILFSIYLSWDYFTLCVKKNTSGQVLTTLVLNAEGWDKWYLVL